MCAAFYEQSQLTLKQNKDSVDVLRREGKELRTALANMHKERGGTETSAIHEAELTKVEQALTLLRQRQNQVMCGNKAKEKALKVLEDELKDLQVDAPSCPHGGAWPSPSPCSRTLQHAAERTQLWVPGGGTRE